MDVKCMTEFQSFETWNLKENVQEEDGDNDANNS
jgi:hypothetical protein